MGDLIGNYHGVIMGDTRSLGCIIWLIGVTNLLTKSPCPPSKLCGEGVDLT